MPDQSRAAMVPPGDETIGLGELQAALAEADSGQVVEHAKLMRAIRAMFEGSVTAAELEAFDRA